MSEPVHDGITDCGLGYELVPCCNGPLGGDDGAGFVVAVVDLYDRSDRTIIGDRAFGSDPEKVAAFGVRFIEGSKRAGVIPVVKHFPGHGVTTVESHAALPVVRISREELLNGQITPFAAAIDHGAPAVMTAHILFTGLDPEYPATLSTRILSDLLRKELGFDGVIVSDGMSMRALSANYPTREILSRMFDAGVDLVLTHNEYDVFELIDLTLELFEAGEISRRQIERGTRRVLELKARNGLLPD